MHTTKTIESVILNGQKLIVYVIHAMPKEKGNTNIYFLGKSLRTFLPNSSIFLF